jgi:hypothetical protein
MSVSISLSAVGGHPALIDLRRHSGDDAAGSFTQRLLGWGHLRHLRCRDHGAEIGGVLRKVTSTDPEVGLFADDDAWFRVLGSPDGAPLERR